MSRMPIVATEQAIAHLDAGTWARANARLVVKMLAEFSHELLIAPVPETEPHAADSAVYTLTTHDARVRYRFRATVRALEHWHIEPATLEKTVDGAPAPLDAVELVLELRAQLGIGDAALPTYLEEITATLYSLAWKLAAGGLRARDVVDADFQQIEAAMTEGHPAFIANSGRVGFDSIDYRAYTPEAAAPIRLVWVAAHVSRAQFTCSADRSYAEHLAGELDAADRTAFAERLEARGLDADDYRFMPVHPWQWHNRIVYAFAGEIAAERLVYLGFSQNAYQAQQSIRTLFNRDAPTRCYVKMALSILNMGFTRGLSPYYMRGTPEINDWIDRLLRGDAYLCDKGFTILREVAAIGYRHPHFEAAAPSTDGANKMLAALWRESPYNQVEASQRLMTMAALLHRDAESASVIGELVDASPLDIDAWLARYLDAYMSPLLHCFYAHDLVFMPHGENIILVLEDNVPVRAIMKDIAEEVGIMNTDVELPGEVARLAVEVPEELKVLSLFTDLFDLIFRYIADILADERGYPPQAFWQRVADCVRAYQAAHPEFADKFARYDLFAPAFKRSCLNRLQLRNNAQMIDLDDPAGHLQFAGTLANPIADL
ncbi:IucA/IucC family protein [Salinisphaera orenii]|uniref:IucA/IucC family protein n=1 Tax=Salinisphaera orenii TaxID=856731 RepID=UPI000F4704CB|nr:IucA/IucC family siderophore biosynthesis protein [Salinisphaera halophila]